MTPQNNNKNKEKPKVQKIFLRSHCSRQYNCNMLPTKTVNCHFLLMLTSKNLPYKMTT